MLALVLLLIASVLGTGTASAAPGVRLDEARDGTVLLVGSGWHAGQHIDVALDRQIYPAEADSAGNFEIVTGLDIPSGIPLQITLHRPGQAWPTPLAPGVQDAPHPMAVLFAQSMLEGLGWLLLGMSALGIVMALLAQRRKRWE